MPFTPQLAQSSLSRGEIGPTPLCKSQGREILILIPIQIAIFAFVATYMVYSFAELRRRNQRSWPAIVSRLSQPGAQLTEIPASPVLSRWDIFSDAGVLLEMADYVERNAYHPDAESRAAIRAGATQARLEFLKSLVTRSSTRSNPS